MARPTRATRRKAYAVAVVLLGAAAVAVYALGDRSQLGWAIATPDVLFREGLGAFVKTYRCWRAPHLADLAGSGFLLTLSLLAFGVPAMNVQVTR